MADTPSLHAQQFALSRHLRAPTSTAAPVGIDKHRLAVYRSLVHNNLQALLASNFPVIRKTLGDEAWLTLVRDFLATHRCHTPLFTEIGREFIAFLEQRADTDHDDPAWLPELAHYEWVELALQISDATPAHAVDANLFPAAASGQALLNGIPVFSPHAWALAYRWPVHRIGPTHRPQSPPDTPTLLLVRRDAGGDVRFAQLSPLAFRLAELLTANTDHSGQALLYQLAEEAGDTSPAAFIAEGTSMLARMYQEGILLGVRARA